MLYALRITSAAMTTSFRILSGCDSGSPGRLRLGPGQWRGPNQVNHDPTKLSPSVHLWGGGREKLRPLLFIHGVCTDAHTHTHTSTIAHVGPWVTWKALKIKCIYRHTRAHTRSHMHAHTSTRMTHTLLWMHTFSLFLSLPLSHTRLYVWMHSSYINPQTHIKCVLYRGDLWVNNKTEWL